jgi:predicted nucleic acid-binding protein
MSVLVDTNVLLRRIQPDHEHHAPAIDSVARLLATGEQVYFTFQNISEFWNVMTRPITANGLVFSPAFALGEVDKIETVRAAATTSRQWPTWLRHCDAYRGSMWKAERPYHAPVVGAPLLAKSSFCSEMQEANSIRATFSMVG